MREPLPGPEEIAKLPKDGGDKFNRLVFEKSPLLQRSAHARINWYPWGKEALALAKEEEKPIFLSIGCFTGHWDRVMEKECFEHPEVAKLLNARYIAIKADRDERPDLDRIYALATQVLTQRTGWPNSLWLTPEGEPFFAGTFFHREDAQSEGGNRPGLTTLLDRLATFWESRREAASEQATRVVEAIDNHLNTTMTGQGKPAPDLLERWHDRIDQSLDRQHGGFSSGRPKFPPHASLQLLLTEAKREFAAEIAQHEAEMEERGEEENSEDEFIPTGGRAWTALKTTLDAMAIGGIYDQVGGGFHRYATDEKWSVPRFEKLLSDNAQLAGIYADAYRLGKEPHHARIARNVVQWMLRELKDEDDGFQSAVEADSEYEEGEFYVWKKSEILNLLGPKDGELYCEMYGVKEGGNWHDQANGKAQPSNILRLERSLEDEASFRNEDPNRFIPRILAMNKRLLEVRSDRFKPTIDTKVLTAWNGLVISALAKVGAALEIEGFIESARLTASFVTRKLIDADKFHAVFHSGKAYTNAYLDDYAFVAKGMLDLHEATLAKRWLESSRRLTDWMIERFYSEEDGFYFTPHDHEELLKRIKDPLDSATPSGNGVATSVLLRLARLERNKKYMRIAESTLNHFGELMETNPRGTESLLEGLFQLREIERSRTETEQETFPRGDIQLAVEPIRLSAYISTRATRPDQNVHVALRIVIEPQFHLPAVEGTAEASFPTSLKLTDDSSFKLESLEASPPEKRTIGGEAQIVHSDDLWICATLKSTAGIPEDRYKLPFELNFQACDDENCLPKEALNFTLPIALEVGAPKGINRHKEIFDRFFWEYGQR